MTETTTTTTHNVEAGKVETPLGWITLNPRYFTTIPGILKLVQLFLGIICMACAAPAYISATDFFLFVAVTSFLITFIWAFIYFFSIKETLTLPIHWVLTELIYTLVVTLCYFIAFIVQLSAWSSLYGGDVRGKNISAGVFGLFNTFAYAAGLYYLYLEYKSSPTNQ